MDIVIEPELESGAITATKKPGPVADEAAELGYRYRCIEPRTANPLAACLQ